MGEQVDRSAVESRRAHTLGMDARCRICGFADRAALQRDGDGIICYECASALGGRPTIEDHHPIGKANDMNTTVGLPGNFHRMVDAAKVAWPDEVRSNTTHDPLLLVAAIGFAIRDFANAVVYYAQYIIDWILRFRTALVTQYGDLWWSAFALPSLWEVR